MVPKHDASINIKIKFQIRELLVENGEELREILNKIHSTNLDYCFRANLQSLQNHTCVTNREVVCQNYLIYSAKVLF